MRAARVVVAAIAVAMFGVGLLLSGMTRPEKVLGFLDFTGHWDPSLAFVMIGAIGVHRVLFRLITKRRSPLVAAAFRVRSREDLSPPLFAGSAIFGVGWGLGGYCPGPALVSLATLTPEVLVFTGAMLGGIFLHRALAPKKQARAASECAP